MFLDKTASKVKGYVNISVCGFFVERFLNLALKDDIKLWNLKRDVDLEVKASKYEASHKIRFLSGSL